MDLRWHG